VHVIEVILAPTTHELSEVRFDGEAVNRFYDHTAALAFAEHYAMAVEQEDGAKPFISVCGIDGIWVALAHMTPK
jgi:hypothetical protein